MSISISLAEYELCQSFKFQLEEKKKEFFELDLKILDREEKLYSRTQFFDREIKIAKETIRILNEEINKARKFLEILKKECGSDKKKLNELEKKTESALKEMKLENNCES